MFLIITIVYLSTCVRFSRLANLCLSYILEGATVLLRSAPSPEGPWSAAKEIYTATPIDEGLVYAGVAYPYLDESGKTLTMAFTNNNHIQVIRVTFV